MSRVDALTATARQVERLVNDHLQNGGAVEDLALTMMGVSADLLTCTWGAPRVLAAFDVLVEGAAAR